MFTYMHDVPNCHQHCYRGPLVDCEIVLGEAEDQQLKRLRDADDW